MSKLEQSLDSIESKNIKKRPRVSDSEDEAIGLPTKKGSDCISQQKMAKKNAEAVTEKNDGENNQVQNKSLKQENGSKSFANEDNCITDKTIKITKEDNTENEISSSEETISTSVSKDEVEKKDIGVTVESDKTLDEEEKINDGTKEKYISKNRAVDTEVVEGLELSVECASEKEELNSESENENDKKPRAKTIIVKAEPNESELECSSSEEEIFSSQEATNTLKREKRKKKGSQTNSGKLTFNESDDSQDNNSSEDCSLETKKTNKSVTPKKSTKRSVSRKGQNKDVQKNVRKKSNKHVSDDKDLEATLTDEKEIKIKNKTEEELSKRESSMSNSESNNNSVNEDTSAKRKRKRNSIKPEDNSKIQKLKKYLKVAGIRVKSYDDLWADCNTNVAKINRLKKLLEDNGVTGRPTLEKCKLVRQKRERIKEVSELDTSNIISEGRITRTQRNIKNKKTSSDTDTSTQHHETRNIFKRIRTFVDSDSE
ncbi:HIRA-interacting protein 3-like [Pseudomyrmex gracilis]|uniref:HIRA-interacting protein 3-like n=1 Tax=Pseudomyrmex gracilis TaxID=219809 RepID=UPI000994BF13|nr:HIRA-interacting protein 3-like [Pseudomyrmex gracilis]